MESIGQHLDELAEIHTAIGNVVEDSLQAVTLIFHIANLHLQTQILGNLAGADHGIMLAALCLGIFLHIHLARFAIYTFYLNVGAKIGFLHLKLDQTACHSYRAYVMAGV